MDRARNKAWATIQTNPDVAALVRANQLEAAADYNRISRPGLSGKQLKESQSILEMTNR